MSHSHSCSIPGLRPTFFTPSAYKDLSTLVDRASFILSLSPCVCISLCLIYLALAALHTLDHPRPIPISLPSLHHISHRIHIPHATIRFRYDSPIPFCSLTMTCTSSRLHAIVPFRTYLHLPLVDVSHVLPLLASFSLNTIYIVLLTLLLSLRELTFTKDFYCSVP